MTAFSDETGREWNEAIEAALGADEIARLVKAAEAFRVAMIESGATAKVGQNLYFDQLRSLERAIVSANALLSRAGDQSNSTQKDGSR